MEQSFPLEILLWIGKPAEFSTLDTKHEKEKDGGQGVIIIIQKTERGRRKQMYSQQNVTLVNKKHWYTDQWSPKIRASQSHEGLLKYNDWDPPPEFPIG